MCLPCIQEGKQRAYPSNLKIRATSLQSPQKQADLSIQTFLFKIHAAVDSCNCGLAYTPVCGVDGQTYGNACIANCTNQAVASQGECQACANTAKGGEFKRFYHRRIKHLEHMTVYVISISADCCTPSLASAEYSTAECVRATRGKLSA